MATFTIVGSTTLEVAASTDPQSWTLPLHVDAEVGDYMLLALLGSGFDSRANPSVDARLTTTFDATSGYAGGFGEVTDLSDVEFTSAGMSPGLAVVTVVRPSAGFGVFTTDYYEGVPAVSQAGRSSATDALLWVSAQWGFDGSVSLDPPFGDVVGSVDDGGGSKSLLSVAEWHGSPPAGVLDATGVDLWVNQGWVVLGQAAPEAAVLRNHQSPLWTPSRNSTAYLLRNKQTPYVA